ncbi:MAG: heparinase II/III family protein [Phycisphaerales bacterium]|nr:MAG: heparinase II/III family protein [Phycisphaerales bacterium]
MKKELVLSVVVGFFLINQVRALSLSEKVSKEKLAKTLVSSKDWKPFPSAQDRDAWQGIKASVGRRFVELGEQYAEMEIQTLPATVYLQYKRVGNRSNYEGLWKKRRTMLHCLVVAECIEGRGRFLDRIADVVWAICEESSWTYPAHISRQKAGVGLPDVDEPIVALFSAETGSSLAWTWYLLRQKLDEVSPLISKRIEREVNARVLTPFLERDDFGWMGFRGRSDGRRPNNWNPWINSNVLTVSLLMEPDQARRAELVHKVLRSVDNFLVPYPEDGSCDEGPSYWGHAGASLFDNLDLLYGASAGRFDVYGQEVVKNIGRFIYRANVCEDYFVNIGDCDGRFGIYRDLVWRYGARIGDRKMQNFARYGASEAELFSDEKAFRSLGRLLHTIFNAEKLLNGAAQARQPLLRDVWLGDEDMQMMAARDREGTSDGLYLACWAGHNGQSHNHNDVGNFIVFANGRPFVIDVGKPTYTRQTFSSQRYQIWLMQSDYHNLPTVNGQMQQAGRDYAAKDVQYEAQQRFARFSADISGAYPRQAGVKKWGRTARLNRGGHIEITDSFELEQATGRTAENLMTPCELRRTKPGEIVLRDSKTGTEVVLQYDADKLEFDSERIELGDERLTEIWGDRLYRIRLTGKRAAAQDNWMLRFSHATR